MFGVGRDLCGSSSPTPQTTLLGWIVPVPLTAFFKELPNFLNFFFHLYLFPKGSYLPVLSLSDFALLKVIGGFSLVFWEVFSSILCTFYSSIAFLQFVTSIFHGHRHKLPSTFTFSASLSCCSESKWEAPVFFSKLFFGYQP